MTPAELLRDMQAAHAARTMYHRAAERHADRALVEMHRNRQEAIRQARAAIRCQRAASNEYEGARR